MNNNSTQPQTYSASNLFNSFNNAHPSTASLGYLKALTSVAKDFFSQIEQLVDEQTQLLSQQNLLYQSQVRHQGDVINRVMTGINQNPTQQNINMTNHVNGFQPAPTNVPNLQNIPNQLTPPAFNFGGTAQQNIEPQISVKKKKTPVVRVIEAPVVNKIPEELEKDKGPSSFLVFFYENRIFIKKQFKGLTNLQISKKAGELWKQFDESQKDVYKQISDRIKSNPIQGVTVKAFDGVQEYKRQMGLPTVDNPEIIKEFKENSQDDTINDKTLPQTRSDNQPHEMNLDNITVADDGQSKEQDGTVDEISKSEPLTELNRKSQDLMNENDENPIN